jgi:hypothetical protein
MAIKFKSSKEKEKKAFSWTGGNNSQQPGNINKVTAHTNVDIILFRLSEQ